MSDIVIRTSQRVSKGALRRAKKASQVATLGALAVASMSAGAWAQCSTTNDIRAIVNYAPFASSSVVNSIVTTLNTVHLGSLAQSTALVSSPPNAKADQQGAGTWSRVVGGYVDTEGSSSANITSRNVTVPATFQGTVNCDTKASQEFIATQFGFDLAKHNFAGGANFHLGLTGGYTDVTTKDKTPTSVTPSGLTIPGGSYEADTQIPFAGVYAALYAGPITVDAQVRWDWIRSTLNDPVLGIFNQPHDVHSTAFLWNAAYRFDLANNWFVEPSIGGVWSVAEVDRLSVVGSFNAGDDNGTSPGSLQVNDVQSVLGRASLRVGTTFTSGNLALQPFVVGSVFREFAGNVISTFEGDDRNAVRDTTGLNLFTQNGTITTSRIGTYGHIGVGIAGVVLDSGWLGYARIDYRAGENIESVTANAGIRYQFSPPKEIEASLKDAKPYASAPQHSWTGIYAGYISGVVSGRTDFVFTNGNDTSPDPAGYLLGGAVGGNLQMGHLVLGVEGDWGWSNAEGGQACPNGSYFSCTAKIDSLGVVAGRVGLAWNRALIYAKGGLGFADVTAGYLANGGPAVTPLLAPSDQVSKTMTGLALGVGVEFAFSERWSGKVEYMRVDFDRERFATGSPFDLDLKVDTVRAGLNYRFGYHGASHEHDSLK